MDIQKPTGKIYKDRAIYIGTFLGGPLVAGYFIAENFKVFGQDDSAKKTWGYTIIATIIIFGGLFLVPEDVEIPNQIIPLIYTGICSYLVKHFQGQNIKEHINLGGNFFSLWRTIGIGFIGLALILMSVFAIVFFANTTSPDTTKNYGFMKHEIVFDQNNIKDSDVDNIADGLTKTNFFDEAVTKYVYVKKVNSNFEVSISCIKSVASNAEALEPFVQLRAELQTFFPSNKIVINLVVENLDNVVKRIE